MTIRMYIPTPAPAALEGLRAEGLLICKDDGRSYIEFSFIQELSEAQFPEGIEAIGFSILERHVPITPERELGEYEKGTAKGTVQGHHIGEKGAVRYTIYVSGEKKEDVLALWSGIRGGTMPPKVSFSAPSSYLSRQELLEQNARLQKGLEKLEEQNARLRDELKDVFDKSGNIIKQELELSTQRHSRLNHLEHVHIQLQGEIWPFCTKVRIIRVISEILKPSPQEESPVTTRDGALNHPEPQAS